MILGPTYASSIPNIGFAITASQSGKTSIPVAPSNYIYSQFEHVSGIPAPEGGKGVAINKLKILNVLIEQLIQLRNNPKPELIYGEYNSEERIDAMIEQFEKQVEATKAASASAAKAASPYNPTVSVPLGSIVDLLA